MSDPGTPQLETATPPLGGPLAEALERGRDKFNTRFSYASRINHRLDAEAFSEHLVDNLRPIVEAVADEHPERVDAVTEVLYDLSLDLVGRGYLGPSSHTRQLDVLWSEYLPALATFVAGYAVFATLGFPAAFELAVDRRLVDRHTRGHALDERRRRARAHRRRACAPVDAALGAIGRPLS